METFQLLKRNTETKGIGKEEFSQIFDTLYVPIRNFIYYKVGDVQVAEDIAQETFLKVWEKRHEIIGDTVKSLVYTIANNLFINRYDRKKVEQKYSGSFTGSYINSESPEFEMEMKEFDTKLQRALAALNEKNREVFLMNRIDGLKYNEIAENLNISVKAVEKRMSQALATLRQFVEKKI